MFLTDGTGQIPEQYTYAMSHAEEYEEIPDMHPNKGSYSIPAPVYLYATTGVDIQQQGGHNKEHYQELFKGTDEHDRYNEGVQMTRDGQDVSYLEMQNI